MTKKDRPKWKIIYIRKKNPVTGEVEDIPYWVNGDEIYAIKKKNPATGELETPKPLPKQKRD